MTLREPWRTRLLLLSFAVNLFAVPMAATRFLMHRPSLPGGGVPPPQVMIDRLAELLPPDDANHFRTSMEDHVPDIEVSRARMEAARAAMGRAIARTPFDPDAVRAAMSTWQAAWKAWSDDFGSAMLAALGDVSPDGRERLANAGRRHPPR